MVENGGINFQYLNIKKWLNQAESIVLKREIIFNQSLMISANFLKK